MRPDRDSESPDGSRCPFCGVVKLGLVSFLFACLLFGSRKSKNSFSLVILKSYVFAQCFLGRENKNIFFSKQQLEFRLEETIAKTGTVQIAVRHNRTANVRHRIAVEKRGQPKRRGQTWKLD